MWLNQWHFHAGYFQFSCSITLLFLLFFFQSSISVPVISKSLISFALAKKQTTSSTFSQFPWFCQKKPRRLCCLSAPPLWKLSMRPQLLERWVKAGISLGTSTPTSARPSSSRRTATAAAASRAEDHRQGSVVIHSHPRKSSGLVRIQVCDSGRVFCLRCWHQGSVTSLCVLGKKCVVICSYLRKSSGLIRIQVCDCSPVFCLRCWHQGRVTTLCVWWKKCNKWWQGWMTDNDK